MIMQYSLSTDSTRLTITIDEKERAALREIEEIQSDKALHEFLEPLICNSEFDWVSAANTGDLTDAPMLGILSAPEFKRHNLATMQNHKNIIVSCDTQGLMVSRVLERWAYMDYQVRSALEDLRDNGNAVFIGGN